MTALVFPPLAYRGLVIDDWGSVLAVYQDGADRILPLTTTEVSHLLATTLLHLAIEKADPGAISEAKELQLVNLELHISKLQQGFKALGAIQNPARNVLLQRALRPCQALYGRTSATLRAAFGLPTGPGL